jgi:hypothetical protein
MQNDHQDNLVHSLSLHREVIIGNVIRIIELLDKGANKDAANK